MWRVRGVPADFDNTKLADVLQRHPDLQFLNDMAANIPEERYNNGVVVNTLASDLNLDQIATVHFANLPTKLDSLERNNQLVVDIQVSPGSIQAGNKRKRDAQLTIDEHFDGLTVLSSPPNHEHQIDVLAISGLGSHAFGSFVHKHDGNMWLADSLPWDIPGTRVMIYGYHSGLQQSSSFAHLGDYARSLQVAISSLLQSEKKKPLVLVGHSLGGLLIKEALIQIADSETVSDLINLISGLLFFGVPNDGLDIESLVPMVKDQPNRFLLESLDSKNSQMLSIQKRNFAKILDRTDLEMFCFYETELSPTAIKVVVLWMMGLFPANIIAGSYHGAIQDGRPSPVSRELIICN